MRPDCTACAFYREIELDTGHIRRLCMLTGEKRPKAGLAGCRFMPGAWANIDAILLAKSRVFSDNAVPNYTKLGSGFSRHGMNVTDIHALDDFSENPISHIAAKKLEGSLVRPEYREVPVARIARERT